MVKLRGSCCTKQPSITGQNAVAADAADAAECAADAAAADAAAQSCSITWPTHH